MRKKILLLLWAVLTLLSGSPVNSSDASDHTPIENSDFSTLQFRGIAVIPFFVGMLESLKKQIEKPLSQSLQQLSVDISQFG